MANFLARLKKPAGSTVGLFLHPRRKDATRFVQTQLVSFLKTKRIVVNVNATGNLFNIAVGGDGSLLGMFRHYPKRSVPAIGIQTGDASAMLELEPATAIESLKKVFAGQIRLVQRLRLTTTLHAEFCGQDDFKNALYVIRHDAKQSISFTALNEMLICSLDNKVLSVEFFIDGQHQFPIVGDGVIIATPTGSTGYNLSAGGAAVEFSSDNILVTPKLPLDRVTPHWVFEGGHVFAFEFKVEPKRKVALCVDGITHPIQPGTYRWEFKKSPYPAQMIRLLDRPFLFARSVYVKGKVFRK